MGKKNGKTLQQKIKKDAERNAIRKAKIERALQEASVQIPFYPDSLMIERCQPEPSTVIFRGLTESIAFAIQDFMPSNFTETPLENFYASIRTDTGKSLHLHWVPFESPVSRFATYHYCVICAKERLESLDANPSFGMNKQVFNKRFVNQVFGFDKLTPDSLKATVYIEYEGVRTFCFVFINHEEKKRLCILTPSVSQPGSVVTSLVTVASINLTWAAS